MTSLSTKLDFRSMGDGPDLDPLAEKFNINKTTIARVEAERDRQKRIRSIEKGGGVILCISLIGFSLAMGTGFYVFIGGSYHVLAGWGGDTALAAIGVCCYAPCIFWAIEAIKIEFKKTARWKKTMQEHPYATQAEMDSVTLFETAVQDRNERAWARWANMDGLVFEREFATQLRKHGWDVAPTKGSGDGGIDIWGVDHDGRRVAIQCKWWKTACGVASIREFVGAISIIHPKPRAIVVCDGGFTKDAARFARSAGVELMDGLTVKSIVQPPHASKNS